MWKRVLLLLLTALLLVHAELDEGTRAMIARKRAMVYRVDFKLQTVPPDFHSPTAIERDNPDDPAFRYWQSIAMLTIPAFAIGILMTFVYLLLILVRGCCGVCKRPREDGYTPKAIAITRGLVLFAGGMVLVGGVIAYVGSSRATDGIQSFFDVLIDTGDDIILRTNRVFADIDAISERRGVETVDDGDRVAMINGVNTQQSTAEDSRDEIEFVDGYRRLFMVAMAIVCSIGALSAMIAAAALKPVFCWPHIGIGLISLFISWGAFGVHLGAGTAVADLCHNLENAFGDLIDGGGDDGGSALSDLMGCLDDNDSGGASRFVDDGATETAQNANAQLDMLAPIGVPATPRIYPVTYEDDELNQMEANTTVLLQSLAVIKSNQPAAPTEDAQEQLEITLDYIDIMRQLNRLTSCTLVLDAFDKGEELLCGTFLSGADLMMVGGFLSSFFYLVATVWSVRGLKRFAADAADGAAKGQPAAAAAASYEMTSVATSSEPQGSNSGARPGEAGTFYNDSVAQDIFPDGPRDSTASTFVAHGAEVAKVDDVEEHETEASDAPLHKL